MTDQIPVSGQGEDRELARQILRWFVRADDPEWHRHEGEMLKLIVEARASERQEVEALRARVKELEGPSIAVQILERENAALRKRVALQDEYIELLGEELHSVVGLAFVHGWRSTDAKVKRGKELREALAALTGQATRQEKPKQTPLSDYGASCDPHMY